MIIDAVETLTLQGSSFRHGVSCEDPCENKIGDHADIKKEVLLKCRVKHVN